MARSRNRAILTVTAKGQQAAAFFKRFGKNVDNADRSVKRMGMSMRASSGHAKTLAGRLFGVIGALTGIGSGVYAIFALRRALKNATTHAKDFETAMARVRTLAEQTDEEFRSLTATTAGLAFAMKTQMNSIRSTSLIWIWARKSCGQKKSPTLI